jgi:hypothetical protein
MSSEAREGDERRVPHLIAPFAVALAIASVLGRGVAPSAVGAVSWSEGLILADAFVAQLVAVAATGLCVALLVASSIAPRAAGLRIALVVLGALGLLVALSAAGVTRVPRPALVLVASSAAGAAMMAALTGARRLPELALGLAGLGAVVRLVAVQLAAREPVAASTLAALVLALELGIVGAAAFFALRAPGRGAVVVAGAAAVAAVTAWIVVAQPEAPSLVVARHALERLAPRPHPFAASALPTAVAAFGTALAVGVCLARRADRAVVGSLALVALVRTNADVPLLGVALIAASLALFLGRTERPAPRGASPRGRGTSPHHAEERGDAGATALPHDVPSAN